VSKIALLEKSNRTEQQNRRIEEQNKHDAKDVDEKRKFGVFSILHFSIGFYCLRREEFIDEFDPS
jgi:hypothetical protein